MNYRKYAKSLFKKDDCKRSRRLGDRYEKCKFC